MKAGWRWSVAVVCFSIALLLIFGQHWGMTFTNPDDPAIVSGIYSHDLWQNNLEMAKNQGRFWLVPISTMAQLPFLLDSWPFVNVLRLVVNGLVLVSFVIFCIRLTDKFFGLLAGLVWLALIDINSSDFSPIHGYLMMFNLPFFLLFISFIAFLNKLENDKGDQPIILPYALFACALLAYEPMFFYSLVFPALYLYKKSQNNLLSEEGILLHTKRFLARNYILVVVLVLYVLIYLGFRKFVATKNRELDSGGSLYEIVRTIYEFSIHGFAIQIKPFIEFELLSTLSISMAVIFALAIGIGLLLILPLMEKRTEDSIISRKKSLMVIAFFVFSPNFLLGLTSAYRERAATDPHYVGNYLSSFPLAMLIALAVVFLVGGRKSKNEPVLFFLMLYLFFSSACANFSRWEQLAEANRAGSERWREALHQLAQYKFASKNTSLVCSGRTPDHVAGNDQYWSLYMSEKFGANIEFVSRRVSFEGCGVVLKI